MHLRQGDHCLEDYVTDFIQRVELSEPLSSIMPNTSWKLEFYINLALQLSVSDYCWSCRGGTRHSDSGAHASVLSHHGHRHGHRHLGLASSLDDTWLTSVRAAGILLWYQVWGSQR